MAGNDWQIKMLYDGGCPLCSREVRFLRSRDRHGRIAFEDISGPSFDPERYGLRREDVTGRMHAVLPDGSIVTGMAVFRRVYRAIGLGWLLAPTGWPVLRPIFDLLYRAFARVRPLLPRRRGSLGGGCEGECSTARSAGDQAPATKE